MAKKFNLGDYLKTDAVSELNTEQIVLIDVDRIDPDPDNFYSLEGIDDLAGNIELIGLQQPLRVRPNGERFTIVSGHRRRAAILLIRDGGSEQFAQGVPCIVEYGEASPAMRELRLIYANSATRVMSSAEISKQAERVTELLYQLKEQGVEFPGRMREHVAQACQVSASKLARLHAIRNNLDESLLALYDKGTLKEAAAYELQKLPKEAQAYLGAQKKIQNNGISMYNAERLVKSAESYLHPSCKCPDGEDCTQTLARFKQTATTEMSYRQCPSGMCCLNCRSSLSDCPYQCARSKAQLEQNKADEKAEKERQAEKDRKSKEKQRQRLAREYGEILKLAEAAGLSDDARIRFNQAYTVGQLRERARGEGFYEWTLVSTTTPISSMYAKDLAESADALGVSVDFLLGRERKPETQVVTAVDGTAWQTGEPAEPGWYCCWAQWVDKYKGALPAYDPDYETLFWNGSMWTNGYNSTKDAGFTVHFWYPIPPEPDAEEV